MDALKRHDNLVALVVAAVVFVAMFWAVPQAIDIVRLVGPAVLALLAGAGTKLLLARSAAEITDAAYADDARGQVQACLDLVRQIERAGSRTNSAGLRVLLDRIPQVVPELLQRVERTSPNSLYSSASQLRSHLSSLLGVVTTYGDIERHPHFYDQPDQQLTDGEQAVRRFVDFAYESVRLVNQGDMASYKANLATVAPPELPQIALRPSPPSPPDHRSDTPPLP